MRKVDLSSLNEPQREAVLHGEGPLLVISAAGSGKTRVLVYRAARLVESGIRPQDVLLCTFTKKAAKEMAERVSNLIGVAGQVMRIGTLHSTFLKILRAEGWPWRNFDIWDDSAKKRSLKNFLKEGGDVAYTSMEISLAKNSMLGPDSVDDKLVAAAWRHYEADKQRERGIDFDDILVQTVRLFEERPDALRRHVPEWCLVDEAQDTSLVQWRILELLVEGGANITAVADWRQAIYGWRGAQPEEILNFAHRFPGTTVVDLPINYRSIPAIVGAANVLIQHSGKELSDMVPNRDGANVPIINVDQTAEAEAERVATTIKTMMDAGTQPKDISILYRVNAFSLPYEESLTVREIPYVIVGGVGFFGRKEVADVMGYLMLAQDPNDIDSLARIINRPTRYLGKAFVAAVGLRSRDQKSSLLDAMGSVTHTVGRALNPSQRNRARDLVAQIVKISSMAPADAIRFIRDDLKYDEWILREEGLGTLGEDRLDNLNELVTVAQRFSSVNELVAYARTQLEKAKEAVLGEDEELPNKVQLMTIHRAKGLEWDTVFVVGVSDGILPHRKAPSPDEERRLMYVALTRARDNLFVSAPLKWQWMTLTPSQFLYEAALLAGDPEENEPLDGQPPHLALIQGGDSGTIQESTGSTDGEVVG
jgi:DNA helicase II / ATP-dependent DNA helicase PcrA